MLVNFNGIYVDRNLGQHCTGFMFNRTIMKSTQLLEMLIYLSESCNFLPKGMTGVVFKLPQMDLLEIQGEYSIPIISLSIIIACLASFTALSMNKRAQRNSFFHHKFWISLAAIAMGFGIWSMHFVGMAAFSLPVKMTYDNLLTFVSILPAMFASYLAFYIANRPKKSLWISLTAGLFMGLGISIMHYVGMIAMKMDAIFVYDVKLFVLSIVVAIGASFIALSVFSSLNYYMENYLIQSMTAIILGLAVSSMHFIGMFAIRYYTSPDYNFMPMSVHAASNKIIVTSVTAGMTILLGLLFLSSVVDRYVRYRTNYYDSLTILPNRRQFERVLESPNKNHALAIWHIHGMEKVNREHGYLVGDKVLQHISRLMMHVNPPMTEVYRIEGNRFAFLKRNAENDEVFYDAMVKVAEVLKKPISIGPKKILISAVCGWQSVKNENDKHNLYSNVLSVLNYPMIKFAHEVIRYNPHIHTFTFEREIANDVGRAMLNHEMYLVYQPKINGKTFEVKGVETLLRWNHPSYGHLSPAVFIPILEENERMLDVTDWIIEKACMQIAEWKAEGYSFGMVAINIPGQYVTSSRLLKMLKQMVHKYSLSPSMLELEITETSFVENLEKAMRAVNILRKEGFSVALDDFGTGVSSLSYLRKIPISTLKIDKSFVDEVPSSSKDSSIIQAIIALGSSLDLSIVFEGVETKEQKTFLISTCEEPIIQGYYFAKPMVSIDLIKWRQAFNN